MAGHIEILNICREKQQMKINPLINPFILTENEKYILNI
jgi:hypothetical protein